MCFSICYLCQQFSIECKEKSDILSTILELYFGIFNNYETVIEHRLEMKKKNILLKEMEKLTKEYKQKYENAMKNVTSLQKKLTMTNSKIKKSEIVYNTLKVNYSRLNTLYERQKLNNFDSIRKLTREQTEYWNMVQERRFNPKRPRNGQGSFGKHRNISSTRNVSRAGHSKSLFTDSIVVDKLEEEDYREIAHNFEVDADKLWFLKGPLKFEPLPQRSYSAENPYYEKLSLEADSTMCKTEITESVHIKIKNVNDAQIQTDNIELYKIDKLLTNREKVAYNSEQENNDDFSEVDLDDSDEVFNSLEKFKNLPKSMLNTLSSFQKGVSFYRKEPIHKFGINASQNKRLSKVLNKSVDSEPEIDVEREKNLYEETKALLDEELDGFEDPEEFESELPRRINEAMSNLNERLKYLKKDEFGDPIIEEGFLEEPQGKNLQVSALRLTNLLGMLFKNNSMPDFKNQISKLLKNFSPNSAPNIDEMKNNIMSGKGINGILGMLQKNMLKTNTITKSATSNSEYPQGFNSSRRHSSISKNDVNSKFLLLYYIL